MDILCPHQYNFWPKRSNFNAFINLYCKITSYLGNKHHSLGIFLDLSKAFDTLNRDILFDKLHAVMVSGALLNIGLKLFFSGKKEHGSYNNTNSSFENIIFSVPLGVIFGPLLFILYSSA